MWAVEYVVVGFSFNRFKKFNQLNEAYMFMTHLNTRFTVLRIKIMETE